MPLNQLAEKHLRIANRMFATMLILWGYVASLAMATDNAGWDDPVFTVVRTLPYTPYSWAAILLVAVSIYMAGEVMPGDHPHRGSVIITGASLCMFWHLGMALAMSRMVYIMPMRITDLWPLIMSLLAVMYSTRIIVYANIFHGSRWNTNPYQLWGTTFLMIVSLSQVIIGVAPSSVFTEVERPVAFQVAVVNFLGASVVMFGLHLRNERQGIALELAGTVSMVATLGWYVVLALHRNPLAGTTLGFGLAEAYLFATLHRAVQILTKNWAAYTDRPGLERKMTDVLRSPPLAEGLRRDE